MPDLPAPCENPATGDGQADACEVQGRWTMHRLRPYIDMLHFTEARASRPKAVQADRDVYAAARGVWVLAWKAAQKHLTPQECGGGVDRQTDRAARRWGGRHERMDVSQLYAGTGLDWESGQPVPDTLPTILHAVFGNKMKQRVKNAAHAMAGGDRWGGFSLTQMSHLMDLTVAQCTPEGARAAMEANRRASAATWFGRPPLELTEADLVWLEDACERLDFREFSVRDRTSFRLALVAGEIGPGRPDWVRPPRRRRRGRSSTSQESAA